MYKRNHKRNNRKLFLFIYKSFIKSWKHPFLLFLSSIHITIHHLKILHQYYTDIQSSNPTSASKPWIFTFLSSHFADPSIWFGFGIFDFSDNQLSKLKHKLSKTEQKLKKMEKKFQKCKKRLRRSEEELRPGS